MRWKIMAEVQTDEKLDIIEAFKWNGASEDGIARAKDEASKMGLDIKRLWAEEIK